MTDKKLYLVETVSMFRIRYVVEAKEEEHAMDEVVCKVPEKFMEFSQKHIDECISSAREITEEEYLKLFNKDNSYLSNWCNKQKLSFINKIDYRYEDIL